MANISSNSTVIYGTNEHDIIIATGSAAPSGVITIDAGFGNDVVVAGHAPVTIDDTANNASISTALNIDTESAWTTAADVLTGATVAPHTAILATGGDTQDFYAVTLAAGSTITIDVDFASGGYGGSGFDSLIQLLDGAGNLLAKNDDAAVNAGGRGSVTGNDSFLSYTVAAAGVYYINVARYAFFDGNPAIPATAAYLLNVSATGHAASASPGTGPAVLNGQDGNDYLVGGASADILQGGTGDDVMEGGGDFDTASYAQATAGVTVSLALTGAQDTLGAGIDTLSGIEWLAGSAFADVLSGDDGNNRLDGGAGSDTMFGGGGNDRFEIVTTADTETIDGGTGLLDTIVLDDTFGWVVDLRAGTAGNRLGGTLRIANVEWLEATSFADILTAGAGTTILAAGGDDYVYGARGVTQTLDGGDGIDTLDLRDFTAGARLTLNLATGASSQAGARFRNFENVQGSDLGETILGTSGANRLSGFGGDDRIDGAEGLDTIDGGDGDDALTGGADVDSLIGGAGIDAIDGGTGIDAIDGGEGDDTLAGGADGDVLSGGAGNDDIDGGTGNDTITGGSGNDAIDGGADFDYVSYSDSASVVIVNLARGTQSLVDGVVVDTLTSIEGVIGSNLSDFLYGDDSANILSGGGGVFMGDSLFGGGGNDILLGGSGNDQLHGGAGADTINGGADNDYVYYVDAPGGVTVSLAITEAQDTGGDGIDTLIGVESLIGSRFDDVITGSADYNDLSGNRGSDVLYGGGGNDTFRIDDGDGDDHDIVDGGDGSDTIFMPAALRGWTVDLLTGTGQDGAGNSVSFTSVENLGATNFNDVLTAAAGSSISGFYGDDLIYAAVGAVFLTGAGYSNSNENDGNDTLDTTRIAIAQSGPSTTINFATGQTSLGFTFSKFDNVTTGDTDDTITGDGFANVIRSGAGNDTIYGGGGNDLLEGDLGDDTIDGGLGDDAINGGGGFDTVTYATAAQGLRIDLNGGGARATDQSDALVSIEGVIGSAFQDEIYGSTGNNTLSGGGGSDYLAGGAGNDTLRGGAAADTLLGGLGNDILEGGTGQFEGLDTASYVDAPAGVFVSLAITTAQNTRGAGADTLIAIEALQGSAFADRLTGNDAENVLNGNGGNDVLSGGGGSDQIMIGDDAGRDIVDGGSGSGSQDTLTFGTRGWTIDTVAGSAADGLGNTVSFRNIEILNASSAADVITAAAGITVRGGAGDDLIYATTGAFMAGDEGIDTLDTTRIATANTASTISLADGNSDLGLNFTGFENVTTGATDDTVTGNATFNVIRAGAGNDTVNGGAGGDQIWGGTGDDILNGGNAGSREDNDAFFIENNSGHDIIDGGDIYGNRIYLNTTRGWNFDFATRTGNDGAGNSIAFSNITQIYASGAADVIRFAGSNAFTTSVAFASGGNDLVYVEAGSYYIDGGDGVDTLDTTALNSPAASLTFNLASGSSMLSGSTAPSTVIGFENLTTGNTIDTITGSDRNNILQSNGGNDTIDAGAGADSADGGMGNDTLDGGSGNDTLIGGGGRDRMTGGAGADRFVFRAGETGTTIGVADIITDFARAQGDRISVALIDAIAGTPVDDRFAFIGTAAFGGVAGQLRYEILGNVTYIHGDVNGDAVSDLVIRLDGVLPLIAADFQL